MNKLIMAICLCCLQVIFGCGGGGGDGGEAPPENNLPPVADAGADQFTYDAAVVILAGTASDPDGSVQSHQWAQTGGETVILDDPTRPDPSFAAPSATGTLTFSYTVTDDDGAQDIDTVSVYVSKVLFSDTFDDNSSLSNWVIENDTAYLDDWDALNGELFQRNSVDIQSFQDSYHLGTFVHLNGSVFPGSSAFRFSVDVFPRSNITSREGNDVGVIVAYTDPDNYYRLSMNSRYGFTRLEKREGGFFNTLAVNSIGYIDDQPMTITVEVSGDTIIVLIDDDPVFAESNLTISPGTVALYSQDKVSFDNVVISDNSLQPMVVVSSPLAHTIALGAIDGDTLSVEAVVLNNPIGGRVAFTLDSGSETDSIVSGNRYSTQFLAVADGEHEIAAILKDADDVELNRDINTVVGVGGNYIIAVGDSIINGVNDEDPTNNDSMDGRIVAIQGIAAPLNDQLTTTFDLPHIVFNEGLPADRSTWLVGDRMDSKLERHPRASTMLLLIGTNDASSGTSAVNFETNVTAIVTAALVDGVDQVYIARILPRYDDTIAVNAARNSLIADYNARIVNIVANDTTGNIRLGPDFYALFEGPNTALFHPDLLHPNDAGYQAMADEWHAFLTSIP